MEAKPEQQTPGAPTTEANPKEPSKRYDRCVFSFLCRRLTLVNSAQKKAEKAAQKQAEKANISSSFTS